MSLRHMGVRNYVYPPGIRLLVPIFWFMWCSEVFTHVSSEHMGVRAYTHTVQPVLAGWCFLPFYLVPRQLILPGYYRYASAYL